VPTCRQTCLAPRPRLTYASTNRGKTRFDGNIVVEKRDDLSARLRGRPFPGVGRLKVYMQAVHPHRDG
jgi:hypothetical protein